MYNPPTVSRELARDAYDGRNSFSKHAPYCDNVGGVSIDSLVEHYGSPLFVFSEKTIVDTARRMKKAFHSRYSNTVFGWSYKTNYLAAICNIFHREGWIAEVVSEFEYDKAVKSGILGKDIIYNGPHKSKESIRRALTEGALVQIDNWDELEVIEDIVDQMAREHDVTPRRVYNVGIRTWMENPHLQQVWSKFGFALDNGEAERAALRIIANPSLRLHTLHSHIGTQVLEPKAYGFATEQLVTLRDRLYKFTRHRASCINLGGGFPSGNLWYIEPEDTKHPSIEEYAKEITNVLNRIPAKRRPQLRLETGRHLIDEAGYLVSSVAAVKGMARGVDKPIKGKFSRGGYILDVGVHLLYCASWFRIKAMPTKKASPLNTNTATLFGCLCMAIDVIRDQIELPPLDTGDKLVFHPVGAYNLTQSMQFINLRPAVVLVGLHGNVELIRRREVLTDLDSSEIVPQHLRLPPNGLTQSVERMVDTLKDL